MGLNSVSDLLQGVKRLFVGLQGVKSDGVTMENIKTNDVGAMKVSAELTGSIPLSIITKVEIINDDVGVSIPSGSYSVVEVNYPEGYKYKQLEIGLYSEDTFENFIKIRLNMGNSGSGQMKEIDGLISASRGSDVAIVTVSGAAFRIFFWNGDAVAHTVRRYVVGITN